jgi:hypothetical protein
LNRCHDERRGSISGHHLSTVFFFFSCGNFVETIFYGNKSIGNGKCDVLLAHDWGAGIAWELVIRHPQLVRQFVPMNCPHPAAFVEVISTEFSQICKSWSVTCF